MAEGPPRPLSPHGARRDARVRVADRAGAGDRRRLGRTRGGRAPAGQARRDRGPATHAGGRAVHVRRHLRRGGARGAVRVRGAEAAVAARVPRPERDRQGAGDRPARGPPAGQHRPLQLPDDGRDRHRPGAARRDLPVHVVAARRRLPALEVVLPRGDGRRPGGVRRADLRLDRRPRSAASRGSSTR